MDLRTEQKAERRERQVGKALLADEQQDKHDGEGEEPGNLPQALKDAHLGAGEGRALDGEVVEQNLPGGKAERRRRRKDQQQDLRPSPAPSHCGRYVPPTAHGVNLGLGLMPVLL